MQVEIVTHCWNYSRLLTYQLSSLLLYPPKVETLVTVFAAKGDQDTINVVEGFRKLGVNARLWILPKPNLLNRAIGRNLAAQDTEAGVVWFTDADYLFRTGALDALASGVGKKLYRPRSVEIHFNHATGDDYIDRITEIKPYDVDPKDFEKQRLSRAIGGVQIVSGDTARRYGYLPASESHQAEYHEKHFKQSRSDRAYRNELQEKGVDTSGKLLIPGVYRIRHSESGVLSRRGLGRRSKDSETVRL
jgi:hypothetical protein